MFYYWRFYIYLSFCRIILFSYDYRSRICSYFCLITAKYPPISPSFSCIFLSICLICTIFSNYFILFSCIIFINLSFYFLNLFNSPIILSLSSSMEVKSYLRRSFMLALLGFWRIFQRRGWNWVEGQLGSSEGLRDMLLEDSYMFYQVFELMLVLGLRLGLGIGVFNEGLFFYFA